MNNPNDADVSDELKLYWKAACEGNIDFDNFCSPLDDDENHHKNYNDHKTRENNLPSLSIDDERLSNDLKARLELLTRIFTLHEANPNDPQKVAAYKYLYTKTSTLACLKREIINSLRALPAARPIILVGERGSGKTTVQNKFFTNCGDFLDQYKLIFVRCDAHKIFKLWENSGGGNREATISTYILLQALYVSVKYGYIKKESKALVELINNCLDIKLSFWINKSGLQHPEESLFSDRIKEIVNDIGNEDQLARNRSSAMIVAYESGLRKGGSGVKFQRWLLLANILRIKAEELGYSFLQVVDGVDNVLWHKKMHEEAYSRIIKELDEFLEGTSKKHLRLACIREESMIRKMEGDPSNAVHASPFDVILIRHVPPLIKELVNTKLELLRDTKKLKEIFGDTYIDNRISDGESYNSFLSLVDKYAERFFSETESYICEIHPDKAYYGINNCPNCSCNEILKYYHNNLRAYCFNMLSYLSSAITKELSTSKSEGTVMALLDREVYRNYFLDGSSFIKTTSISDGSEKKGGVFFNIFWFDLFKLRKLEDAHEGIWFGLCVFRLYQTLSRYKSLEHDDLVNFILKYFDYPKEIVVGNIKKCIAFGLFTYDIPENEEIIHKIRITSKANLCMRIAFSKVDILYYLGLDSPLSSKGINIVSMHSEIGGRKTPFLESAIRTSCYLLRHITKQHELEIIHIRKVIEEANYSERSNYGIPKIKTEMEAKEIFSSPIDLTLRTRIDNDLVKMLRTLKKGNDNLRESENENPYSRTIKYLNLLIM